jgi:hypothetical protein
LNRQYADIDEFVADMDKLSGVATIKMLSPYLDRHARPLVNAVYDKLQINMTRCKLTLERVGVESDLHCVYLSMTLLVSKLVVDLVAVGTNTCGN